MTLKKSRHRHDVINPLGKRHGVQREHIQAVILILAEITDADFLGHVAVGCRHDAHINWEFGLRTNWVTAPGVHEVAA